MYGKKGFTLLEILIVVIIAMSVLFFAVPSYKRSKDKAAYTAAQGLLVELRSAMLSMRQDLRNAGNSVTVPTSSSQAAQLQAAWQDEADANYSSATLADMDVLSAALVPYALFAKNYLQPIPFGAGNTFSRYEFYLCPVNGSSDACCGSDKKVVACMRDDTHNHSCSYPTKGLYYGARIWEDGTLHQIDNSASCQ